MNTAVTEKINYWEKELKYYDFKGGGYTEHAAKKIINRFISDLKELKEAQEEQLRLHEKALDVTIEHLMKVQAERNELKEEPKCLRSVKCSEQSLHIKNKLISKIDEIDNLRESKKADGLNVNIEEGMALGIKMVYPLIIE